MEDDYLEYSHNVEKTLIHPLRLQDELMKFRYFVDEKCRLVDIEKFFTIFTYKYANSIDDIWQYWIENNKLYCENISNFMIVFPLQTK